MEPKRQVKRSILSPEQLGECCWALANNYVAAATQLTSKGGPKHLAPSIFLLLHGLERHLKAYLFSQGMTEKQLRKTGHDLTSLLRSCNECGFTSHIELSWPQLMQVARANVHYRKKEFEYFVPLAKRYGNVTQLLKTVQQVGKGVGIPVTANSFRKLS